MQKAYWISLFFAGRAACNIVATMFMIFSTEVGVWNIFTCIVQGTGRIVENLHYIVVPTTLCAIITVYR